MRKSVLIVSALVLAVFAMGTGSKSMARKTGNKSIYVGKTCSVARSGCRYSSKNTKVAYVDDRGIVVGKKKGTTTIYIKKKSGALVKEVRLRVKGTFRRPSIGVSAGEVKPQAVQTELKNNCVSIKQEIKNRSKSTVKKWEAEYRCEMKAAKEEASSGGAITVQTPEELQKTITVTSGKTAKHKSAWLSAVLSPGGESRIEEIKSVKLVKLEIYSRDGVVTLNPQTGKWTVRWAKKDTKGPVISGIVGKKAYNSHYNDVCRTVYKGKESWLLKYVSARDARDGKVKVTVDTSKVNWGRKGVYTVYYKAKDRAGNVTRVPTKVQVRLAGSDLDRYAASILKNIVREGWSDERKARAIYRYVRGKMAYVDSNDHASWERSALHALRYNSGNCFAYYSLARLLMTRCGIVSQTVTRYRGHGHHWWNYVYVRGGWYHLDTTPRRIEGDFCLKTGAQMTAYSQRAGNSHIWNPKWIPAGAKKRI